MRALSAYPPCPRPGRGPRIRDRGKAGDRALELLSSLSLISLPFKLNKRHGFQVRARANDDQGGSGNGNGNEDGNSKRNIPPGATPSAVKELEILEARAGVGRRRARRLSGNNSNSPDAIIKEKEKTAKGWESMSVQEKLVEMYVGEKGILFWLNKFAYASIFIIVGAWILFRFVGPSLGLYQLQSSLLEPSKAF